MKRARNVNGSSRTSSGERALVIAALLSLYLVWGSTYYAMRIALVTLPPYLMAATRFSIAGFLLFAFLLLRGARLPSLREWLAAGAVGTLLLVMGNGFVLLAERSVDSGTAATVVATMPLWMAGLGWLLGERPRARELLGLGFGFSGIAVLHSGDGLALMGTNGLLIVLAPIAWAVGSLCSRRLPMPNGSMSSACQMLLAGVLMVFVALLRGERLEGPVSLESFVALGYLIVFGSLLGFSAYGYLLSKTRPLIATSYAYVNPVVALAIGALLGGERLSLRKLGACALTAVGVLIVTLSRRGVVFRPVEPARAR
ncbi:MAG TPA: drug/metabolite exporter YedA [Polyangiaceae bacterium]|nr:drug/metabolite exporter YedA [Polyangiaceae bacterium]